MARRFAFALVTLLAAAGPAHAQQSPYTSRASQPIKALAPDEIAGYLAGAGMGFALAAELNGYPGPRHVLELADSLGLDAEHRAAVQAVFADMSATASRRPPATAAASRRWTARWSRPCTGERPDGPSTAPAGPGRDVGPSPDRRRPCGRAERGPARRALV